MALPVEQSNESSVKPRLVELINTMPEDQCRTLLPKLEAWTHKNRRKHPRNPCSIPVDYATKDQAFKGFIKNVSSGGVFIHTNGGLNVGEKMTMTFSSPDQQDPVKITGEIVRKNMIGVGVRFTKVIQDFEKSTWIDCRSKVVEVSEERRIDPRVEFQCPVEIEGLRGEMKITDISISGVFVECQFAFRQKFRVDQSICLVIKLPTEDEMIRAQARIIGFGSRGLHCKFIHLARKSQEAIEYCFNVAKHTLPIR